MIDAGLSIQKLRQLSRFRLSKIDALLVDHEHGDHARAAADIMWSGVDVYMSHGTAEALGMLGGYRLHIIQALRQFQVGSWTIMPFEAIHDAAEPLGFLLTDQVNKILYLTDSRYCRYRFDSITHFMVEANHSRQALIENRQDELLHEEHAKRVLYNHMSIEAVVKLLSACDLSQTEAIHLIHMSGDNADPQSFQREIQQEFGIPTYAARP